MQARASDRTHLKSLPYFPVIVIAVATFVSAQIVSKNGPVNLDFEQGEIGEVPTGWTGDGVLSDHDPKTGQRCAKVSGTKDPAANLYQYVDSVPYRNKKIRFRAAIRTASGCQAQLHFSALGISGHTVHSPAIVSADWKYAEVSSEVRPQSGTIFLRFSVQPGCDAWIDDASLSVTEELPRPPTKLVMIGTGTPIIDPERSGPALAVIANDLGYLVDAGPGVVRRAQEAATKAKIDGVRPELLKSLFITHLHSDHTVGYPDLIFTPAVGGRDGGLDVYGPPGLQEMTDHLLAAWRKDMDVRINGPEHGNPNPYKVVVHEITPGVVYKDDNVTIEAVPVKHTTWDYAFGYKFVAADRTIVVSGDTAPTESIVRACSGCDVLVHEVVCDVAGPHLAYQRAAHTSAVELAKIATEAKPKLLVLYHTGCPLALEQVQKGYSGKVVAAKDFDVF